MYGCFTIHTKECLKANKSKQYSNQRTRVLTITVLDTFITEIELHFNELNQRASTLLTLILSIITKPDYHEETMTDLIGLYRNNLPISDIVDQELLLWKNNWFSTSAES